LTGDKINKEWTGFAPESGSLNIPRAEMPQIKAEHRGAMVNFLNARGVTHGQESVDPTTLKPTQAEFSPAKVNKAKSFDGGDRSILISSDNHIVDGHHQWMAKLDKKEPINVIRLNKPIKELLSVVSEFPSAANAKGATEAKNATDLVSDKPAPAKETAPAENIGTPVPAPAETVQKAGESVAEKPVPVVDSGADSKAVTSDAPSVQTETAPSKGAASPITPESSKPAETPANAGEAITPAPERPAEPAPEPPPKPAPKPFTGKVTRKFKLDDGTEASLEFDAKTAIPEMRQRIASVKEFIACL
jgi:hypothetical protein